ncbi:uncharacterized protein MONOS_13187 [Monocercomonoides exilis]|uniref:uncharacterized protein n=1 Tax=Monocercomonoides exilis TaxID=2049356 RepID=UPI00355965C0|nr:hypothetical protein MONOS_13187 [Monocercomonoides exilis]|eukprot:MONOS_13187.1-p1 / transcript=MONOS_13187.1 / gene=MONOS_13187 / organism=Monocercomonoides_exilis_PA203 / gene_product=unspecified product / transcript_product=unspecified product / location=Mono_scaffold00788:10993-12048(-) / protein_length=332 / sequence_SO=supercontig / SO=protein_coding / is_pseudo=false
MMTFYFCSSLRKRYEKKNEFEKDERILGDVCTSSVILNAGLSVELLLVCVPCLLKAAFNKEENKETKKEVEMALLSLSTIGWEKRIAKELYLDRIKEIIRNYQEHHNLTQLAYQSAWYFLIKRFHNDGSLEDVIVDELHLMKETTRELEELAKHVNLEEEKRKLGKMMEVHVLKRWFNILNSYFDCVEWKRGDCSDFVQFIVELCRVKMMNDAEMLRALLNLIGIMVDNTSLEIESILKGEAIEFALEEICQSTLDNNIARSCIKIFFHLDKRLSKKKDCEHEEAGLTAKREINDRFEEEGLQDEIISLSKITLAHSNKLLIEFNEHYPLF